MEKYNINVLQSTSIATTNKEISPDGNSNIGKKVVEPSIPLHNSFATLQ